ncbi:MAG: YHS domain-containing protein [Chloroflexi bacterium]|nr:YHS domain-containing protein [Chloroflexota bacterium]
MFGASFSFDALKGLTAERDPVCGTEVEAGNGATATHEGKTYHFCGTSCQEAFAADPKAYVSAMAGGQMAAAS